MVILISLIGFCIASAAETLSVGNLRCEYKTNPLGIDVKQPRLSWQLISSRRNTMQSAYLIRVAASVEDLLANTSVWDSGKITSDQSVHVVYGGPALASRQRVYWQVRVWDDAGKSSSWSDPAYFEMGLLSEADWQAQWIRADLPEDTTKSNPAVMMRKEFQLAKPITSARLYITALGLYEAELNGQRVGDQVFTPGWTSYDHRLQYQTYDVTSLLQQGANAIGVTLGDGWYRGRLAWGNKRNIYGKNTALLAQLEVLFADGGVQRILTDASWKAATGPILLSDIYDGEVYDARLQKPGWSKAGFDDSQWNKVVVFDHPKNILVAAEGLPVRKIQMLKPVKLLITPAGEKVIDMGQNMVGWIRFTVQGEVGDRVRLRHAEVLDKNGNFYTENLRSAKQTIEYHLKGGGIETFEPHFTFQGFRYVAVDEWPGEVKLENFTGVVVHSDFTPTGTFTCSDTMINQLQHNIQWGQKGNFLDVPTDCPQRDERLGWTGDAQVFARTACFNADVAAFYTKWLKDLAADQKESGAVPHVIPNVLNRHDPVKEAASAGWADAAVVVPWIVYLSYGDTRILQQQYPSMKAWVDYMANKAGESYLWTSDFTFGDWLAFATTRSDYPGATTDKDLICQAYFARSTALLLQTAKVLGYQEDAQKYGELLEKIKKAFQDEFLTPNGRIASNTQTAYCLALAFDLFPEGQKKVAAERLAKDVRHFKHLTTGFLGTPLICDVLGQYGYLDEAYMLLTRKQYPSWLYPITRGATTIWERWDGIKADSSFQNAGMNSFNHYAYGAIGEWLYRFVAGIDIDPAQPGYKHILIQPHPLGELSSASACHRSLYGNICCSWVIKETTMTLSVEIPANTRATVRLPQATLADVKESGVPLRRLASMQARQQASDVILTIGSGKYTFRYKMNKS